MHLALLDIDAVNLPKAKEVLASTDSSLKTEAYLIDVGNQSQWDSVAAQVQSTFSTVDLVLLNAAKGTKPKDSDPWVGNIEYWRQVRQTRRICPICIVCQCWLTRADWVRSSTQTSLALLTASALSSPS
jgi:NAD(P)-dependent dehydrogenase (short-subunit alcohol dehydrogenase family)